MQRSGETLSIDRATIERMTIASYTQEDEFGAALDLQLSASQPIRSVEHLKGRDRELDGIRKSLYAAGRHVFIYGDRGVGKSSLGQTAAVQYQGSGDSPVFVSGSPDDTFNTVIANVIVQALHRSRTQTKKSSISAGLQFAGLTLGGDVETSSVDIATTIRSIGDAVAVLEQVAQTRDGNMAVVIDEFDAIQSPAERNKFAALLKQMGDRSVTMKFIFTGIGKSLDDLLGAHQSAYRQLETVELPRLPWEARRAIVQSAADAFNLELDDNVNWRIAMISDGYPYYIHLITEKILWAAFATHEQVTKIGPALLMRGLTDATVSTSAELRRPYEKAVTHHPDLEDLVWATADRDDLIRAGNDIYESYQAIIGKRGDGRETVERSRVTAQLRRLREPSHGALLLAEEGRKGWYSYREKMLRGYVRMQAQLNGVELAGEKPTPKQVMHVSNARSGYQGSTLPRGVRAGHPISRLDGKDSDSD